MKKIVFVLILIFIFIVKVDAAEITFSELPDKLKDSLTYEEFLEEGITCEIEITNESLDITCDLKNEGKYTTHFDYNGSVLSYNSTASANSIQKQIDSLWILQLDNNVEGTFGKKFNNGMAGEEAVKNLYSKVQETNNSKSFTMNIERGNIIEDEVPEPGDNTNPGNDNENPNPGDNNNSGNDNENPNPGDNTNPGNNNEKPNPGGNSNNGNNIDDNPQTGNIIKFIIVTLLLISTPLIVFYKNVLDKSKEI